LKLLRLSVNPIAKSAISNQQSAISNQQSAISNQQSMSTLLQHDLYRMLDEADARGERVVVATVAHTRGSTPQRRGAKMLFFQNGEVAGTVGGGCIEAEVWAAAREATRTGKSELHHYSLTADEASEEGMVCGERWIYLLRWSDESGCDFGFQISDCRLSIFLWELCGSNYHKHNRTISNLK
jgi:xanthine dehydrogenase accessory factor